MKIKLTKFVVDAAKPAALDDELRDILIPNFMVPVMLEVLEPRP